MNVPRLSSTISPSYFDLSAYVPSCLTAQSSHPFCPILPYTTLPYAVQLIGRTYASDPALFEDVALLDKHSSWTDPVIFSDQTALTPTAGGVRWRRYSSGAVLCCAVVDRPPRSRAVRDRPLRPFICASFLPSAAFVNLHLI